MIDCKSQILSTIPDSNCCSLSFLNVLIFSSAKISVDYSYLIINSYNVVLEKAEKIIKNFYPNVDIYSWDNFLMLKGKLYDLLNDIGYNDSLDLTHFANDCDKMTLLKSLFVACGGFYYNQDNNKNSKGYNLEFVLRDEDTAEILLSLLKEHDFSLKKIKRQNSHVVYTKNSNIICDLFVFLGAGYTALEIQNSLAMREMRNNVNRQNNCFEFNLEKTISASNEQIDAINFIIEHYSIEYLDENLREVALARLVNPDATLSELKTIMNSNISRAGIKYRLDKIIDIYHKLKGDK
ncbi:MAG: DNA-binding protein WhiA [Clostridiales bacterium]|nr:DNA-binding protein WhiA [Clostridiales bacterium]